MHALRDAVPTMLGTPAFCAWGCFVYCVWCVEVAFSTVPVVRAVIKEIGAVRTWCACCAWNWCAYGALCACCAWRGVVLTVHGVPEVSGVQSPVGLCDW